MNKNRLFLIFLFIITAAYYIQIIKLPINPFDEGTMLVGAERLLQGEIPHKDFSTEYPAGQITVLAVLFKLFGTSVTTARIYDLIIKSLLSLFIFLNIRLLSSPRFALAGWAMSLIWIMYKSNVVYPIYPFFLIVLIGVYFFLCYLKNNKIYYLSLSAVFIAFSIPFRIDLGVPSAAIVAFVLVIRKMRGEQKSWTPLFSYLLVAILAGLSIFTYYASKSTIELMFNDLILNPMAFLEHRWFPYPSLNRETLPFYVFPLVSLSGLAASIILIKRKPGNMAAYGALLISLLGIACLNQVRVRSDMIHLLPSALSSITLAPVLLYILAEIVPMNAKRYRMLCILFILVFCITLYRPVKAIMLVVERTNGFVMEVTNPDIERARYSTIFGDIKYVVPYIINNTAENDYIYVGVKNHDKFIYNDPLIYFLAGRKCPSRYHELNPGVNNTLKGQKDMVSELKAKPPRMIILAPRWREEPNPSNIDQNINLIDDHISDNFEYKTSFGMYEVWLRKSGS